MENSPRKPSKSQCFLSLKPVIQWFGCTFDFGNNSFLEKVVPWQKLRERSVKATSGSSQHSGQITSITRSWRCETAAIHLDHPSTIAADGWFPVRASHFSSFAITGVVWGYIDKQWQICINVYVDDDELISEECWLTSIGFFVVHYSGSWHAAMATTGIGPTKVSPATRYRPSHLNISELGLWQVQQAQLLWPGWVCQLLQAAGWWNSMIDSIVYGFNNLFL